MATIHQIDANRRNARNSTGPGAEPGKAVSRFNALKTSIHARSHVIPGEDPDALEALTIEHYDRFQPAAPEQRFLVDAMVAAEWQLRRLRKTEAQLWEYGMRKWRPREDLVPSCRAFVLHMEPFTRLHRRIDTAERSYYRALKQLLQLQSGLPAPAETRASQPPAPIPGPPAPSGPPLRPVALLPAEAEPSPDQSPAPRIGFVLNSFVSASGRNQRNISSSGSRSQSSDASARSAVQPVPCR